jgi:tetratricopeptide (TPR) repeat protein
LRFLLIAKRCEEACKQLYNDPWYYPVKGDNVENTLEDIISNCRKATNFKTRYFLQEVRALIALNRYDECISRWEETKGQIDNDLFYKEIELRVARAYLLAKISDKDKAVEIYARYGDAESLMYVGGNRPRYQ